MEQNPLKQNSFISYGPFCICTAHTSALGRVRVCTIKVQVVSVGLDWNCCFWTGNNERVGGFGALLLSLEPQVLCNCWTASASHLKRFSNFDCSQHTIPPWLLCGYTEHNNGLWGYTDSCANFAISSSDILLCLNISTETSVTWLMLF